MYPCVRPLNGLTDDKNMKKLFQMERKWIFSVSCGCSRAAAAAAAAAARKSDTTPAVLFFKWSSLSLKAPQLIAQCAILLFLSCCVQLQKQNWEIWMSPQLLGRFMCLQSFLNLPSFSSLAPLYSWGRGGYWVSTLCDVPIVLIYCFLANIW